MVRDYLEVFHVEELAIVFLWHVIVLTGISGTARQRVRLARRSADEDPMGGVSDTRLDAAIHVGTTGGSERGVPSLSVGQLRLFRVAIEDVTRRAESTQYVVVLAGNSPISE